MPRIVCLVPSSLILLTAVCITSATDETICEPVIKHLKRGPLWNEPSTLLWPQGNDGKANETVSLAEVALDWSITQCQGENEEVPIPEPEKATNYDCVANGTVTVMKACDPDSGNHSYHAIAYYPFEGSENHGFLGYTGPRPGVPAPKEGTVEPTAYYKYRYRGVNFALFRYNNLTFNGSFADKVMAESSRVYQYFLTSPSEELAHRFAIEVDEKYKDTVDGKLVEASGRHLPKVLDRDEKLVSLDQGHFGGLVVMKCPWKWLWNGFGFIYYHAFGTTSPYTIVWRQHKYSKVCGVIVFFP
ncbi:hypothetical protein AAVH_34508 [Aphelenchoides avenae]|nr:hypothetical protein AAVH_34508 [Aphelenchus avenae]